MTKSKLQMVGEPPSSEESGNEFSGQQRRNDDEEAKIFEGKFGEKRKDIRRIHATVTWRGENILSIELEMEASRALYSFLSVLFFGAELCTVQRVHTVAAEMW